MESLVAVQVKKLVDNIERVVYGKRDVVQLCVVGLLARGHILIEDVPGIGKTTIAHAIARSLDCKFSRIQFTSDMLPSDILGVSILNHKTNDFEFRHGPIFANIVLADERISGLRGWLSSSDSATLHGACHPESN
jgi:MoxR-like ATPase